jgi:hypothetical protein
MITCVVVIDGLTLLSYFTQVSLFKLVLLCLYLKSFQRTLSSLPSSVAFISASLQRRTLRFRLRMQR